MGVLGTKDFPLTVVDAPSSGSVWRGRVTVGASPTMILSSSLGRTHASVFNHSNASIFLGYDFPAVGTSLFDIKLASGSYYELPRPIWRGALWAVADVAGAVVMLLDISGSIG